MVLYSSTCFRVRYGLIRIRIRISHIHWGQNCVPFSHQLFVGHVRSARRFPRLERIGVISLVLVFVLWFSRFASSLVSPRRWCRNPNVLHRPLVKIIIDINAFRLSAPPTKHILIALVFVLVFDLLWGVKEPFCVFCLIVVALFSLSRVSLLLLQSEVLSCVVERVFCVAFERKNSRT